MGTMAEKKSTGRTPRWRTVLGIALLWLFGPRLNAVMAAAPTAGSVPRIRGGARTRRRRPNEQERVITVATWGGSV